MILLNFPVPICVLKQCIQSCLVLRGDTTKITAVSIFFSTKVCEIIQNRSPVVVEIKI